MQRFERQTTKNPKMTVGKACFLLGLSAIFVLVSLGGIRLARKFFDINRDVAMAKERLEDLENRKATLEEIINGKSTPFGVEKELREKYNMVLPGEVMIVVVGDTLLTEIDSEGEVDGKIGEKSDWLKR